MVVLPRKTRRAVAKAPRRRAAAIPTRQGSQAFPASTGAASSGPLFRHFSRRPRGDAARSDAAFAADAAATPPSTPAPVAADTTANEVGGRNSSEYPSPAAPAATAADEDSEGGALSLSFLSSFAYSPSSPSSIRPAAPSPDTAAAAENNSVEYRTAASASSVPRSGPPPRPQRTRSFPPLWDGTLPLFGFGPSEGGGAGRVRIHTLILGTHPSEKSLSEGMYYSHPMNAFWWIAGDCLGFRRASGLSASGEPYKFAAHLRHGPDRILPLDRQLRALTSRGFALWDILESCERRGSLDSGIREGRPNAVREFCASHPDVRRIVLSGGSGGSALFGRHFRGWWLSGELRPGGDAQSTKAFAKFARQTDNFRRGGIECVSAVSVSPAAAMFSYDEKRAFWEEHVYGPGLRDHEELDSLVTTNP